MPQLVDFLSPHFTSNDVLYFNEYLDRIFAYNYAKTRHVLGSLQCTAPFCCLTTPQGSVTAEFLCPAHTTHRTPVEPSLEQVYAPTSGIPRLTHSASARYRTPSSSHYTILFVLHPAASTSPTLSASAFSLSCRS